MKTRWRISNLFKSNEAYIALTIVFASLLIQIVSGQFYTANNIVDNIRAFVPSALFSIGVMLVLISGGIDLSFPAVASLSSYIVIGWQNSWGGEGSLLTGYVLVVLVGMVLGAVNGFLIAHFKFQPMIVTLATSNIYTGILQGALRCHELFLPEKLLKFGKSFLFEVSNEELGIKATMPTTVLFVIAMAIIAYLILQKTMIGRGIFAIGGDQQSALRAGFPVFGIQMFVYMFAGAVAAFSGYTKFIMNLYCVPTSLIGTEQTIIAGVVLGGVRITGGVGTITGAFLGTMLLTIVRNSLLLLNIPTYWQTMITAVFIIVGTGITGIQILVARHKAVNVRSMEG